MINEDGLMQFTCVVFTADSTGGLCAVFVIRGTAWLVFNGGMPRANFSDRHTVSVVHGSSHVTFDFTSRVVDFTMLSQPAAISGL